MASPELVKRISRLLELSTSQLINEVLKLEERVKDAEEAMYDLKHLADDTCYHNYQTKYGKIENPSGELK